MCSKVPVDAILNVVILLVHFLWLSRLQASAIIFGKSWEFVDSITVSLFVCVFFSLTNSETALGRAYKWVQNV